MTNELQQLLAASAAIIALEKIASSGRLPEHEEQDLRLLIVRVSNAFSLPTWSERTAEREYDNVISLVSREMAGGPCALSRAER